MPTSKIDKRSSDELRGAGPGWAGIGVDLDDGKLKYCATSGVTRIVADSVGGFESDFAGPWAFGRPSAATAGNFRFRVGGTFTSDGAGTTSAGQLFDGTVNGAAGDTSAILGTIYNNVLTTAGGGDTIGLVAQLRVNEPQITVGAGDTVSVAATLVVLNAPTEGTKNYAVYIDSGLMRYDAPTQTTVGAAGGASALPATPTGYLELDISGTSYVIPYYAKA